MKILIKGICGGYVNFDNVWSIEPHNSPKTIEDENGNYIYDEKGMATRDLDWWIIKACSIELGEMAGNSMTLFEGTEEEMNEWFEWLEKKLQVTRNFNQPVAILSKD